MIMEAQRRPREEAQRDLGRFASIFAKIPSVPHFISAPRKPNNRPSNSTLFKMTKMPKSAIVPEIENDPAKQNGLSEWRYKRKQKSLLNYETSSVAPVESDETRIEPSGHKTNTEQGKEMLVAERLFHSGEASTSAIDSSVTAPSAAAASATATPSVVEKTSRKWVKKMAHGCYVDVEQPLSPEIERAWESKILPWLDINLVHLFDDVDGISRECVMAGIKDEGSMYPTILVVCRDMAQEERINDMLKRCPFIPIDVQCRIIIGDIVKCTSKTPIANPIIETIVGSLITIDFDHANDANVLYANVARIFPVASEDLSRSCTIGGMISVNGRLYGLTTAHQFAALSPERQATPIVTPGMLRVYFFGDLR